MGKGDTGGMRSANVDSRGRRAHETWASNYLIIERGGGWGARGREEKGRSQLVHFCRNTVNITIK